MLSVCCIVFVQHQALSPTVTCFSISAPGIGNRVEALVLGDFPEEEAKDFLVNTILPPDLRLSVTEEVWKGIYQV